MSNKDYHNHEAIGSSLIKSIHSKSVFHAVSEEFKNSEALTLGRAVHTLCLEPENFEKEYACNFLSKEDMISTSDDVKAELKKHGLKTTGKKCDLIERLIEHDSDYRFQIYDLALEEFNKVSAEKELITSEVSDKAHEMAKAVLSHPIAQKVLSGGEAEYSYFSIDKDTKLEKKCRPDYKNGGALIDLKTTRDASFEGFSKQMGQLGYLLQAAYYLDVHNEATGEDLKDFFIVAVENKFPYAVAVYKLDHLQIEAGREQYKRAFSQYADYLTDVNLHGIEKAGVLHSYPAEITTIQIPLWFLDQVKGA